ncbi:LacI family transcriptional regulator [Gardnerella sp. DNF01162]|uniref:LacI family DNA-binding transcriptional regulator n=1 Tax=Gardnerella TaxID=2701 RepID=UPI000C9C488B|nr:LacI family DNA-binding transcriptional regulator [Gardnerella sp. DNF01162]PMC43660.1 LacI family transcriptional regulator [Gardnerella vaginalis]PNP89292.1 LacI family transcriptional regulator [Gardnerella sp. DNF01162]
MSANIQDVANKAHVSVSTVSRSFTRPNLVSASTRNKVLAIAEQLNFSISKSAAALKSGKTLRIALLISDQIRLWFSASIIQGLNQVFHTAGYDLSIFQISSSKERSEFFTMLPTRRNADAVVVCSFDVNTDEIAQLKSTGVPIVGINCLYPQKCDFDATINIDDDQGARLMARHLIGLGHRNIAYVRTTRDVSLHFSVLQRYHSFIDECQNSGITPTEIVAPANSDRISAIVSMLLGSSIMPTAIACQEDGIAIPLMFQLARSGYSTPKDVSIIGFDDSFYAHETGLTTIRQDSVDIASTAANITLALINAEEVEDPYRIVPAQLIVRSSTAALLKE